MARPRKKKDDMIIVKKYANRRLYDTGRSSYVTLDDLCDMIKEGQEFVVQDAKTGEDLTQSVLTQIIVEQESRGQSMLPPNFLRTLIRFYGDGMQGVVPNYLEQALENFVQHQETFREGVSKSFSGMMPGVPGIPNMPGMAQIPGAGAFDEIHRKNMEMFTQTVNNMFKPFRGAGETAQPEAAAKKPMSREDRVKALKAEITQMQEELRGLISH